MNTITTIEEIEAKASVTLHPVLEHIALSQDTTDSDWNFANGKANFSATLKVSTTFNVIRQSSRKSST
jgi:hypothetical protein